MNRYVTHRLLFAVLLLATLGCTGTNEKAVQSKSDPSASETTKPSVDSEKVQSMLDQRKSTMEHQKSRATTE